MTARGELDALYAEWRTLTEAEGEAIRAGAWPQVEQRQAAKHQLQRRIIDATQRLDTESTPTERAAHERHFRAVVDELIQLEQRNHELVARTRDEAAGHQRSLDQCSRNLRRVQRGYAPVAGAFWESYS